MEVYVKKKPIWVSVRGGFKKEVNFAPDPSSNAFVKKLVEMMNGKRLEAFSTDEKYVNVEFKVRSRSKLELQISENSISATIGFASFDDAPWLPELLAEVNKLTGLKISKVFERYLTRKSIVTVMVKTDGNVFEDDKINVNEVSVVVSGEYSGGFSCEKGNFTGFGLFSGGENKAHSILGC